MNLIIFGKFDPVKYDELIVEIAAQLGWQVGSNSHNYHVAGIRVRSIYLGHYEIWFTLTDFNQLEILGLILYHTDTYTSIIDYAQKINVPATNSPEEIINKINSGFLDMYKRIGDQKIAEYLAEIKIKTEEEAARKQYIQNLLDEMTTQSK